MRIVLLLSAIGFLLMGCGKKNDIITKDMFVGDWHCNMTEYQRFDSEHNDAVGEPKNQLEMINTYKIMENQLYLITKGKDPISINFASTAESQITEERNTDIATYRQKINFEDENHFNINVKIDIKDKSNKTNIINLRIQQDTNCSRIE